MAHALTGRVALVTGAAKGIGAGIAKAMSAAGASVIVNFASDRAGAERVVTEIDAAGGKAFAIQANVSVVAKVERLLAEAVATFGPLDILVNNASVFAFASLEQTTDEQLHKMLDTNLWGTIVTCREALKHFGKDGGSIINIGSMSSERFSRGRCCLHREQGRHYRSYWCAGRGACLTRHPGKSNQPRCRGHRRGTGHRCNE
jgi:3-oxoacyl-[acyl-carrier protein] reductase